MFFIKCQTFPLRTTPLQYRSRQLGLQINSILNRAHHSDHTAVTRYIQGLHSFRPSAVRGPPPPHFATSQWNCNTARGFASGPARASDCSHLLGTGQPARTCSDATRAQRFMPATPATSSATGTQRGSRPPGVSCCPISVAGF